MSNITEKYRITLDITVQTRPNSPPVHPKTWPWSEILPPSASATVVSDTTNISPESLSVEALATLAWGPTSNLLTGIKPHTVPGDIVLNPIRIVPFRLGAAIAAADKDEKFFHVELFPPHHAELWSRQAWHESTTKRLRNLPATTESPLITKARTIRTRLTQYIGRATHRGYDECLAVADLLMRGHDGSDMMLQLLEIPDELIALLRDYQNTLRNESANTESANPLPS